MRHDDATPGHRRPSTELLAERGSRPRLVDEHMCSVPAHFGSVVTFRLQLFAAAGLRPVAVATQAEGDAGSIVNSAERCATHVWRQYMADEPFPPLWVERMLPFGEGDEPHMMLVSFEDRVDHGDLPLSSPSWSGISPTELDLLVGTTVALDRGDGYEPQPDEPPEHIRYEAVPIDRMPPARPFRVPGCMAAGRGRIHRVRAAFGRSRLRRRIAGEPCCWYHAGDWHRVNRLADQLLDAATRNGTDDVKEFVLTAIREADWDEWTTKALWTLFAIPIDLNEESIPPTFVNGQHRVQAMRDARVQRTVVARFE